MTQPRILGINRTQDGSISIFNGASHKMIYNKDSCCLNKSEALRLYETQLNDEIFAEIIARMKELQGERIWGEKKYLNML